MIFIYVAIKLFRAFHFHQCTKTECHLSCVPLSLYDFLLFSCRAYSHALILLHFIWTIFIVSHIVTSLRTVVLHTHILVLGAADTLFNYTLTHTKAFFFHNII
jgi:hypothetical protein